MAQKPWQRRDGRCCRILSPFCAHPLLLDFVPIARGAWTSRKEICLFGKIAGNSGGEGTRLIEAAHRANWGATPSRAAHRPAPDPPPPPHSAGHLSARLASVQTRLGQ